MYHILLFLKQTCHIHFTYNMYNMQYIYQFRASWKYRSFSSLKVYPRIFHLLNSDKLLIVFTFPISNFPNMFLWVYGLLKYSRNTIVIP